jgi:sugar transferase (PEP-CTERM/EpsH1 system associated)
MHPGDRRPLIVHVVYSLRIGGLENGLVNLVNASPSGCYRHAIICLDSFDSFRDRIRNPEVSVLALSKRPGQDFGAYFRLWRTLRKLRPDIVHTRTLGTFDTQLWAVLAGIPFRVHGEHGRISAGADSRSLKKQVLRRILRPWIDHYTVVSKDLKEFLIARLGIPTEAVSLVYNGVDGELFHPRCAGRPQIAPPGFFADDSIVIGAVGRMCPVKDQLTLVRAFLDLRSRQSDLRDRVRLALVGDGPLLAHCRELLQAGGAAHLAWLPGERADIPDVLRVLDVFVLPSLSEGTSNTILEAMATGLPIVATRVGGNPELITSGQTGYLVPAGDPRAMSEAIAQYCHDESLRRLHGQTAQQLVKEMFSMQSMVRGYQHVYDALLAHRPLRTQVTSCAE